MNYNTDLMCFSYGCSNLNEEMINALQHSNKIVLPSTLLQRLQDVNFPMFFKLTNMETGKSCVCGVHEFTAAPGVCNVPYRIMEQLWIIEGNNVNICLEEPDKGSYVKLRCQTSDFTQLSNPKAVLEKNMSLYYPVVSKGDTISINYNSNTYFIDITECKPSDTIQIINTDLNVDFDKPLDYKEPEKIKEPENPSNVVDDNKVEANTLTSIRNEQKEKFKKNTEFVPFSGKGNRLGSE